MEGEEGESRSYLGNYYFFSTVDSISLRSGSFRQVGNMSGKPPIRLLVLIIAIAFSLPLCAQETRRAKDKVPPAYPEMAKSMHLAGIVKVQITITPQGAVKDTKIIGGHPLLADAAVRAIQKWRYEPGTEETTVVQVEFKKMD
jgi:TonB family protein